MSTNAWLIERSKVLAKYAVVNPTHFDTITLKLNQPEIGWIDTLFFVNGKHVSTIELSSVNEPFIPMKQWMEDIVENACHFTAGVSMVNIDCDLYHAVLYYEPLLFYDWKIANDNCGILYLYNEAEGKVTFDAFCKTKDLLKNIYSAIIRYGKDMLLCDDFVKDWVWEAYNNEVAELGEGSDEIKKIFLNKITSPIVENYLNIDKFLNLI